MNCTEEVIALITARSGSKRLPGKNLKCVAHKPLIVWSIHAALQSAMVKRVLVSTDDPEIAKVARAAGAAVPFMRPVELAGDDSPHIRVSHHAIQWLEQHESVRPTYVLLLQPTSPFRNAADIDAAIDLARRKNAVAVVSVTEAKPHPYKTYRLEADGTLSTFIVSDSSYKRQQDLPLAVSDNGAIYLNRTESLLRDETFIPLGTVPYFMPPERSLDIDTEWDLTVANLIANASAAT